MTLTVVLAALGLITMSHEDSAGAEKTAQVTAIAYEVAAQARTPQEAAFILAWGENETHYALRIHSGSCRRWECDHGRARGPWQDHRRGLPVGIEWTHWQVKSALQHVRWALKECGGDELGAFRRLGALRCDEPLKGEGERVKSYRKLLEVLR